MSHTIPVEFDESMHPTISLDGLDEQTKLSFAALDTAYKLLREYAVRVTLVSVRETLGEAGVTVPSDDELFRQSRESGVEGAPASYMDLAPDLRGAALALHDAFTLLVDASIEEAAEALGLGVEDGE